MPTPSLAASFSPSRRDLLCRMSGLAAAGLVEPHLAAPLLAAERSLGRLAAQPPSAEGAWSGLKVEGAIPRDLNGDLYRVAPGQKVNHGVTLRHFFDGDAFLIHYRLENGKASVAGRFVATPERVEETQAGKMLYNEFGTAAPQLGPGEKIRGGKNQPSINVIRWDGRLLALSEGGHPSAVDPVTLAFQGHWDFHGTLPKDVSFTAHPKFDPVTGLGYAFGTHQGQDLALMVYRMELDGRLTRIAALPQPAYFMVHDMLLGREHLAFMIPPVDYDLPLLLSGRAAPADALRYAADKPMRVILLRKDGSGTPVTFELPAAMVFHHGNLAVEENTAILDSVFTPDDSILRSIAHWSDANPPQAKPAQLTRLTLDLGQGRVTDRTVLSEGEEFPRFDARQSGLAARYLYTMEAGAPFSLGALVRHDLSRNLRTRAVAEDGHAFEETVFTPKRGGAGEEEGWLLHQGYSAPRNETFLDIRDAATLERAARIWTGQHFPIGFHGNFYGDVT